MSAQAQAVSHGHNQDNIDNYYCLSLCFTLHVLGLHLVHILIYFLHCPCYLCEITKLIYVIFQARLQLLVYWRIICKMRVKVMCVCDKIIK